MAKLYPVLAIDIGGSKIAGGLVMPGGQVMLARQVPTVAETGGSAVLERAIALARSIRAAAAAVGEDCVPKAAGIGTAGDVHPQTGVITFATSALPGWQGIPVRERVSAALDLPVFVDNDGNVMALGEAAFGAGRGSREIVGLTIGTGIGGGIVIDGRVYHGAWGAAGGIGHLIVAYGGRRRCYCGGQGCLEAYASGPAITDDFLNMVGRRRVRAELGLDPEQMDVKQIAALAATGHGAAAQAIAHGARILGSGIATLLNLLNPDRVILGGGVAQIGESYFAAVRHAAYQHALPNVRTTPIVPALLGAYANLAGAAQLVWQDSA